MAELEPLRRGLARIAEADRWLGVDGYAQGGRIKYVGGGVLVVQGMMNVH